MFVISPEKKLIIPNTGGFFLSQQLPQSHPLLLVLPQAQGCGFVLESCSDLFCFLYALVIKLSGQREFWRKGGLFASYFQVALHHWRKSREKTQAVLALKGETMEGCRLHPSSSDSSFAGFLMEDRTTCPRNGTMFSRLGPPMFIKTINVTPNRYVHRPTSWMQWFNGASFF